MVFAERLDPTSLNWRNFIVAADGREIIGIAQIKPHSDCREFGSLIVKPAYRRRGIGRQLVEALLSKEAGEVYLLCAVRRVPYYRQFGFEVIDNAQAPLTLRRKLRLVALLRFAGVHVVAMKRAA